MAHSHLRTIAHHPLVRNPDIDTSCVVVHSIVEPDNYKLNRFGKVQITDMLNCQRVKIVIAVLGVGQHSRGIVPRLKL
jgi:hypothetical protein